MSHFLRSRLRLFTFVLALLTTVVAAPAQMPAEPAATTTPAASGVALAPDAVDALISILKDDAARQQLIDNLGKLQAAPSPGAAAPTSAPTTAASATTGATPAAAPPTPVAALPAPSEGLAATPFVRELGDRTQDIAEQIRDVLVKVGYGLANLRRLGDGSLSLDWTSLGDLGLRSAVTLAIALAAYVAVRRLLALLTGLIARAAVGRRWLVRFLWAAAALALDAVALVVALFAAAIYSVAGSADGRPDPLLTQVISGFVSVEFAKAAVGAIFQSRFPPLALLSCTTETARYWQRRLSILLGFIGYGVLVAHPLVNRVVGFSVGIGFRMVIVLVALAAAIILILGNREKVQRGLIGAIAHFRSGLARTGLTLMIHVWHLLAILYLVVAFLLWVSRPFDAVNFMARATAETLIVITFGGALSNVVGHWAARGIRVPADFREVLPLLEARLNLLVPMLLRAIRVIITAAALALILQSWRLVDIWSWTAAGAGTGIVGRVTSALVIVVIAMAIWLAASSWVEFRLNPTLGRQTNARTRTLLSLFRNAFTIVIVVIGGMLTLSELGIDIAPLIAGAGVVGLAVGFGSQKLVQDIITGAFIQLENAMNEGDVVTVAGVSGVVDRLTIRSVGIRDLDGVYHVIPFSSVNSVSNFMRGFAFHVANIGVAYKEDIDGVKAAMHEAFDRLMQSERGRVVLEPLEMQGVVEFGDNAVTVRARIKTLPGEQWATGRLYNELIKKVFDERGIEIPFPQRTVWFAEPGRPVAVERPAAAVPPSDAAAAQTS